MQASGLVPVGLPGMAAIDVHRGKVFCRHLFPTGRLV